MTASEKLHMCGEVVEGLALGDAFGEVFSYEAYHVREKVEGDITRYGRWRYTDDTEMALGVLECLARLKQIDQDMLAWIFGQRFKQASERGYGKMARKILEQIGRGEHWKPLSQGAFNGGSMGNGGAMRVAPVGIWFAEDYAMVEQQARLSAQVTHWHPEGVSGAVIVALAVAAMWRTREDSLGSAIEEVRMAIDGYATESQTKTRTLRVFDYAESRWEKVAGDVGAGELITAQDTVPYAVWCALYCEEDFKECMLRSVEANGDCDTVAAIAAGILTARIGQDALPKDWLKLREKLIYQVTS